MKTFEHGGNIYAMAQQVGLSPESLIDFSANINPLGPSPQGLESMKGAYTFLTAYPDPHYRKLTEAVATYLGTQTEGLALHNGAIEGLHEVVRYLKPQKAMLVAPCFVEYEKSLRAQGSDIVYFMTKADHAFQIEVDRLIESLLIEQPDLLILCTPNNPTGTRVSPGALTRIAEVIKGYGGALLIDEAFIEFVGNDQSALWVDQLYKSTSLNALYVSRSFTKFFGVPGLRLGALKAYDANYFSWRHLNGVPWNINVFAEHYAYGALLDTHYQEESLRYVLDAKAEMVEALKSMKGLTVTPSDGDYFLIEVHDHYQSIRSSLLDRGILIRSCANYIGLGETYFRVAVKNKDHNRFLIQELKEFFETCADE